MAAPEKDRLTACLNKSVVFILGGGGSNVSIDIFTEAVMNFIDTDVPAIAGASTVALYTGFTVYGTYLTSFKINSPPTRSQLYEDRRINVASRVLTRKNALPPGGHVFQANENNFELIGNKCGLKNVKKEKQAVSHGGHVFQPNRTNFDLSQKYFGTSVLSEFHEAQKNLRRNSFPVSCK
ncbi:hypothetical protein DPMN_052719 [Dreissena polymorpha]|uniref:Uncharacterized protein n=1 Tax=Dreissena polymorpha TaxID=45954 RepID=A0A9D4CLS5_DREPO|nr:hypothetical protein DPMN_052719 [Dreissena polymorpha]